MNHGVRSGAPRLLLFLIFGWTLVQSSDAQNTNFTRPIFNCGGHLVSDSGFLGSEGFPSYYKPNRKCTWYITVPEGHVVMLSFRVFDLEADPRCRYDYVDVYNGHSYKVQRLGRFCGTFRPGALISTSNTMMLQMVTDSANGGRGFLAYFSGGKPHVDEHQFCGGRLTKAEGSVKTPNWPESDYPAGISCSWHITVEPNMIIEVQFGKFDLEADNYCRYDYVAFFNGGETDDSRRIGKYCGDVVPNNVVTNGNELLVQFVSDLSVTSDGFMATYTSIPHGSKPPTAGNDIVSGPRVDATPTSPVSPTPKTKPKPAVKPAIKPTPKPKAKGPTKTTSKPAASKPNLKPSTKPSTKPKPGTKATPKPGMKPSPKPGSKTSTKPTPKPGIKPIPKPGTKPGLKPTPKPDVNAKTKPISKPATKPIPKPGAKPKPKPEAKPKPKVTTGANKPGQNKTAPVAKRPGGHAKPAAAVNPVCAQKCEGKKGFPANFCSADFVITGKVTALSPGSRSSVQISISVLKAYKSGRLALAKTGKTTSVKLLSTCKSCPLLRRGMTYILTGQVDAEGRGILEPSSFTFPYKASLQKQLANLTSKTC